MDMEMMEMPMMEMLNAHDEAHDDAEAKWELPWLLSSASKYIYLSLSLSSFATTVLFLVFPVKETGEREHLEDQCSSVQT